MKKSILCFFVLLLPLAFISANPLNDVIRGQAWKDLDNTSKAVYIKAVEDSVVLLGSANPKTKLVNAYDGILSQDVEKIEMSVNRFYADKDNINISVVDALLIISDYIKGMPQDKIDRLLAAFRQQSMREVQNIK